MIFTKLLYFLPYIGQSNSYFINSHYHSVMNSAFAHQQLLEHLKNQYALSFDQAAHLVQEVLTYFDESYPEFIARRHRELQQLGWDNQKIFKTLPIEIENHRFSVPLLSERQIRRIIYG